MSTLDRTVPIDPAPPAIAKHTEAFRQQLCELPAFRALLRAVEADFYRALPLPTPILDLGCGDGHFAQAAFGSQLQVGLDPWWGPLQEAAGRPRHRWLTNADAAKMPFTDGSFATVVSNSVLEHISQVDPVLRETARVLSPGGWFHFCVPGPNFRTFLSIGRFLDAIRCRGLAERYRKLFDRISRHHYYLDSRGWEETLARAGLSLDRWWPYFSRGALSALEWGHPLGLPSVVVKKVTGRWLLVPRRWNLWLTERLLRKYYEEPLPDEGAYLFFSARKPDR